MVLGSGLLLLLNQASSITFIVIVGLIQGIPTALNPLALQAELYTSAPASEMGTAGGLFQTSRYLGAIPMTTILGLVFGVRATDAGLHSVGLVSLVISLVLVSLGAAGSGRRRVPA